MWYRDILNCQCCFTECNIHNELIYCFRTIAVEVIGPIILLCTYSYDSYSTNTSVQCNSLNIVLHANQYVIIKVRNNINKTYLHYLIFVHGICYVYTTECTLQRGCLWSSTNFLRSPLPSFPLHWTAFTICPETIIDKRSSIHLHKRQRTTSRTNKRQYFSTQTNLLYLGRLVNVSMIKC